MTTKTWVVVNPRARGGRAAALAPAIVERLRQCLGAIEVRQTQRRGHATEIARAGIAEGVATIVAIGGDGTASETASAYLGADGEVVPGPRFAFVPIGTGGDWLRSFGQDGSAEVALAQIAAGARRRIDLGRIRFVADDGAQAVRAFTNIASLGLSGPVDRAVNRFKAGRFLNGRMVFKLATLAALARYRFQRVRVTVDGAAPVEATIALVAVANGGWFGGGMWIAPHARLDDAQLDIVLVRGENKPQLARDLKLVYTGDHLQMPATSAWKGRRVRVDPLDEAATGPVLLDIDGESPGRLPATFDIVPGAVEVLA